MQPTLLSSFLKKNFFFLSLFLLAVLFFILGTLSPTSYGGADDIVHYRFAHYSFQYPELLLDHWAKPVFTLLASPFAQLGYWGVKLFNVLTGAFTAFVLYRIAMLLGIKREALVAIFLFFTPVYATMVTSGMTEILFAAVVTLSAYFFLKKRYIWAAVVISFLPLVRTEGIVIWPVYMLGFIIHHKWKAIPFLLTASAIYSVVGGLYFNDFLWLITHIPYTGTYDIYGHGELLHFVKANKVIFGIPLTILAALGVATFFLKNKKIEEYINEPQKSPGLDEVIVILAPLIVYFCAHSYVWWKGINSLGLIRVMAGVAPLFVIFSLRGLNLLLDVIPIRMVKGIVLIALLYLIVVTPFKVYEIPPKLTPKDLVVQKASEWFKTSPYAHRKYYVWDCFFYHFLGTNPYDRTKMADGIPDRQHPENNVKPGEIVIWDAHFSATDGRFPLATILNNPYYKLVKLFRPLKPFETGGGTYQICFFERLDSAGNVNNAQILDSLAAIKPAFKEVPLMSKDFRDRISPHGLKISKQQEYYLFKELKLEEDSRDEGAGLKIKITSSGNPVVLAVSTSNGRKADFYDSVAINPTDSTSVSEFQTTLPATKKGQRLKIYIWNKDKNEATIYRIEIILLKAC
ncbi:MAG TPA: hypothetical protein VHO90_14880 [Bacteroidales bacterium]|nr:hypothetical protein [Bacteroidales bacterium]